MDAFKFAFETIIIGLLALPWLFVMLDLAKPELLNSHAEQGLARVIEAIPCDIRPALLSVIVFALAYLLGSAITPVSSEFLNDQDWIGQVFPTDDEIHVRVYFTQTHPEEEEKDVFLTGFHPDGSGSLLWKRPKHDKDIKPTDPEWRDLLRTFQYQDEALQLKGTDQVARLTRLHERLNVLQGATFSGFVLLLLCVFALCSGYRAHLKAAGARLRWRRVLDWAAFLPSLFIIVLAAIFGGGDLLNSKIDDLPIMEAVLFLLGAFGLYLAWRAVKPRAYINAWACLFTLFFTVLVYGGAAWSQVSYDQQVYRTYLASTSSEPAHPVRSSEPNDSTRAAVNVK